MPGPKTTMNPTGRTRYTCELKPINVAYVVVAASRDEAFKLAFGHYQQYLRHHIEELLEVKRYKRIYKCNEEKKREGERGE